MKKHRDLLARLQRLEEEAAAVRKRNTVAEAAAELRAAGVTVHEWHGGPHPGLTVEGSELADAKLAELAARGVRMGVVVIGQPPVGGSGEAQTVERKP